MSKLNHRIDASRNELFQKLGLELSSLEDRVGNIEGLMDEKTQQQDVVMEELSKYQDNIEKVIDKEKDSNRDKI